MQNSNSRRQYPENFRTSSGRRSVSLEVRRKICTSRRKSLDSVGSTVSLTNLLDHDSYSEGDSTKKSFDAAYSSDYTEVKSHRQKSSSPDLLDSSRKTHLRSSGWSAWELWVIEKAKSDQVKKQKEKQRKAKELDEQEKQKQAKQARLLKVEKMFMDWLKNKNEEMLLRKRMEQLRVDEEKKHKEKVKEQAIQRAVTKYQEWQRMKKEKEKEKIKQIEKEEIAKKEQEQQKKLLAEEVFQQWLQRTKPRTAQDGLRHGSPSVKGSLIYQNYPEPSFCNPVPWQAPPSTHSSEDRRKGRVKPYRWNPDKYL